MRFGVISDTHIPGRGQAVPHRVLDVFEGVDAIFHAGDFVQASVLEQLRQVAPTYGVAGNCDSGDLATLLPAIISVEAENIKIGMIHDSGPSAGRRNRMAGRFPGHRVVIFGHSHQPLLEDEGGLLLLNPGSACDPRSAGIPSIAILEVNDGKPRSEIIHLYR